MSGVAKGNITLNDGIDSFEIAIALFIFLTLVSTRVVIVFIRIP
jgi:hypothetical protein